MGTHITGLAQDGKAGLQNPLHELGAGARAFLWGVRMWQMADDPSAVYWNPAGLEYNAAHVFTLFRSPLALAGVSYDFLGFVFPPCNWVVWGSGILRISGVIFYSRMNSTQPTVQCLVTITAKFTSCLRQKKFGGDLPG